MSAPLWEGSVLAAGFVFDERLSSRVELLRRLQVLWADQARLAQRGERWYLLGIRPRWVDSRTSPGAPLVLTEGRWLLGPVEADTIHQAPRDSVLECVEGQWHTTPFSSLLQVHPAALLELPAPEVLAVQSLAPPPNLELVREPPPASLEALFAPMLAAHPPAPPPPPSWWDRLTGRAGSDATVRATGFWARPRERLGRVGDPAAPPSSTRPGLWARLRERAAREPSPPGRSGFWARLFGPASSAPRALPARAGAPLPIEAPPIRRETPRAPGFFSRTLSRLLADRRARAQQDYLADLQRRFQAGDLGEALRRAVPLGANGAPGGAPTGAVPGRRESLGLLGAPVQGPPSMVMASAQFGEMKQLYREAADRLIAQGQIEEAAFVLSNLLGDARAAVALLEKHDQLELAAQLATTQHLPEDERLRLWLLAGRTREAILLARRTNNFPALVSALSARAPALATRLRGLWGEFLAGRQRFAEAIAVTTPLPDVPAQWNEWVDAAVDLGGATAVTALALDVSRRPDRAPLTQAHLDTLLDAHPRLTGAAAEALLAHAPQAPTRVYRDLWRRLLRGASLDEPTDARLVERVLSSASDPSLTADAVKPPARSARSTAPLELAPPVVPQLQVLDLAPLPKGRRALAHGAAGLRVIDAEGQTLRHLLVKADRLVVGPVGSPVLVLSLDGALTRVWKLDARTFELTSWFQSPALEVFSPRTDGLCWAVSLEGALVLLDPAAPQAMEWWRVPGLACETLDALGPYVFATGTEAQGERRTLAFHAEQQRQVQRLPPVGAGLSRGAILSWQLLRRADGSGLLTNLTENKELVLPTGPWATLPLDNALLLTRVTGGATEVALARWATGELRVLARLEGTLRARCRELSPGQIGVGDEHGRLTELEW